MATTSTAFYGKTRPSRIGLGLMGMSAFYSTEAATEEDSIALIHWAAKNGVTLLDTAEIYGPFKNEELLGRALEGLERGSVLVASKFGINPKTFGLDSSPATIRASLEGTLKRLNTDYLDIYIQHRPDPKTPVEQVVKTLKELIDEGKIRSYGLSEASVESIKKAHAIHPPGAVQSEFSLWTPETLPTVKVCGELGITFEAYSPLGRGLLSGKIKSLDDLAEDDWRRKNPRFAPDVIDKNLALVEKVRAFAEKKGITSAQLCLAYVLSKGTHMVALTGTTKQHHLEDSLKAVKVELSEEDVAYLESEISGKAAGDRYDARGMSVVNK